MVQVTRRLLQVREVWGSNPEKIKSPRTLPMTRHHCNLDCVGSALLKFLGRLLGQSRLFPNKLGVITQIFSV